MNIVIAGDDEVVLSDVRNTLAGDPEVSAQVAIAPGGWLGWLGGQLALPRPDLYIVCVEQVTEANVDALGRLHRSDQAAAVPVLVLVARMCQRAAGLAQQGLCVVTSDHVLPRHLHAMAVLMAAGYLPVAVPRTHDVFAHDQRANGGDCARQDLTTKLTRREREIFDLVRQGMTNPQIAKKLSIARSTVKSHLESILEKLCLHNRIEIILSAGNGAENVVSDSRLMEHAVIRNLTGARNPTGEGAILRGTIGRIRPALHAASTSLWLARDPVAAYARYLTAMYPVTKAAVPLMRFARRRCLRHPADPLSLPLAIFLTGHIREERGHDRWVRADLAALGGSDPRPLDAMLPAPAIASLIGAQYQLIASVHPVALLGGIAVLEGDPPGEQLLEHIRAVTGRTDAVASLAGHAASDGLHGMAVFALLDSLELDASQRAAVGFSALHTARQAMALFASLADDPPRPAGHMSGAEAAMLAEIDQALADHADIVAHSSGVTGGLFL